MGDDVAVSPDLSNYELLWPTTLFVSEGERILRSKSPLAGTGDMAHDGVPGWYYRRSRSRRL